MKRTTIVASFGLVCLAALLVPTPGAAQSCHGHGSQGLEAAELPGTSIYHLDDTFTDQDGAELELSDLRGYPTVVVMFYAGCTTACPILFSDAQQLERALDEEVRTQTRFVFVTIDPEHDTSEVLATKVAQHGLDASRWTLLRGTDAGTRALAAVLGVQYRADGQGNFSHTNRMSILDAEGTVVETVDGLRAPNEHGVAALTRLVHSEAASGRM